MGCRCKERTAIIKKAMSRKVSVSQAATYVTKTAVQDTRAKVNDMLARRRLRKV